MNVEYTQHTNTTHNTHDTHGKRKPKNRMTHDMVYVLIIVRKVTKTK